MGKNDIFTNAKHLMCIFLVWKKNEV
jgi:hypothetical protein